MNRPLIIVLAGLVLGELLAYQSIVIGVLIPASLLILLLSFHKKILKLKPFFPWICILLIASMISATAYGRALFTAGNMATIVDKLEGESYRVQGRIINTKKLKNGYQSILLKSVYIITEKEQIRLRGKVRLTGAENVEDSVTEGEYRTYKVELKIPQLPKNPGAYNEQIYNYANGVYLVGFFEESTKIKDATISIHYLARVIKERIEESYFKGMYEEDAAMLCAMVFGDKSYLGEDQKKLYQENGVAHLMAVSGLHVSGLGGRIYRILRRRGHNYGISCFFGALLILFYGCMTGFGASVARALLMFLIFLLSEYLGESYDLVSAMSLSGILMLLESPFRIFEGGFLISYGSVLAIGIVLPWTKSMLGQKMVGEENGEIVERIPFYLKNKIFESMVIYGVTCPIIMRYFYECSPYSILLNPLILPFMGILMTSALLGGITGIFLLSGIFPALSFLWRLACLPAVLILRAYDLVFHFVKNIPGSLLVTGCPPMIVIVLIYCVEIALVILISKKCYRSIFLLLFLCITATFTINNRNLRITMLDVGQGDSILCQLPGGESLLIDGGSTTETDCFSKILEPAFNYYGISKIDHLMVTHMDLDHMSAIMELLAAGFPVKNLYLGKTADVLKKQWEDSEIRLMKLAEANETQIHYIEAGDTIIDQRIKLDCLHPKSSQTYLERNNESLVIRLKYKEFTALFTGDLPSEEEEGILSYISESEKIDLLKIAHHGSKYSTDDKFLDYLKPELAMISVGAGNRYGHPHDELMERLNKYGVETYITKNHGAIYLTSDGSKKKVRYWRDAA